MDCIICGVQDTATHLYAGLQKCMRCGLIYADSQPDDDEIKTLYGATYFHGMEYADYTRDKPTLQKNFGQRLKVMRRFSTGGKLLEIGSAYGFFLELAQTHWSVTGIDISEEASQYACEQLGVHALAGEFLETDFADERFDVFCMWDTIEHLRAPHKYLGKIRSLAQPGSLLCLTTGDIESLAARVGGSHWRLIHPPTHLFYFSPRTLAQLLRLYNFNIIHLSRVGFYRSLDQVAYSLLALKSQRGVRPRIYKWLDAIKLLHGHVYLNLFDILFVVAKYCPNASASTHLAGHLDE